MKKKYVILVFISILCCHQVFSQHQKITINGFIRNTDDMALPFSTVAVKSIGSGTVTNEDGFFSIEVPKLPVVLAISNLNYKTTEITVSEQSQAKNLNIELVKEQHQIGEVMVNRKSQTTLIKEKGFSVETIETESIKNQNISINSVLDHSAGIRVRQSGGMGSDFSYSLDGMSGNSIRFTIDEIPIEYFGSVYNINNLPASFMKRVEVYKGVVPVRLASDALGGVINIVTPIKSINYLEASYSIGSFNTHQVTLNGQWRNKKNGFTSRVMALHNYSDNSYNVWGQGVYYYDESTFKTINYTKENPATRFNDNYKATLVKAEVGLTEKDWADKLMLGIVASDVERGIQHGGTMSVVFGKVRYDEKFYMPTLDFYKRDFLTDGLDVKLFSSYAITEGASTDTSSYKYGWDGNIINPDSPNEVAGEHVAEKTLLRLKDNVLIARGYAGYDINKRFVLTFNSLLKNMVREGEDKLAPSHTKRFSEPQSLQTGFAGLSLNSKLLNSKLQSDVFLKYYSYSASLTDDGVNDSSDNTNDEDVITIHNDINRMGGGFATSYRAKEKILLKLSIEKAIRLPEAKEALGNGTVITNSPNLKPEQSLNFNLGTSLGPYSISSSSLFRVNVNAFYRDMKDKIQLEESRQKAKVYAYYNIDKVLGKGASLELNYIFKSDFKVNYNITYLDLRNNLKYNPNGSDNILYKDRVKNVPYFMSNLILNYSKNNLIQKKSKTYFYTQFGYVHQYYLGWPSLGGQSTKNTIPSQFVIDLGSSYTFPKDRLSIAVDVSNLLNTQVYDNFLLQKPGLAFSAKVSYRISE